MDYSSSFLGKKLGELLFSDVVNFFNGGRDESDIIEFKSYNRVHGNIETSIGGLQKVVTAMLNSNGGIVIWGAPEGRKVEGRKEKVFEGQLSTVNQRFEKDFLINKISQSIIPLPVGINVKILNENDDYVYVFEIQRSLYSPHQYQNVYLFD